MGKHSRLRLVVVFTLATICATDAQIVNWNTNGVIPMTEEISPTSGGNFSNWNTSERSLEFADFADQFLPDTLFRFSNLENARFDDANVSDSQFLGANLTGATWTNANIVAANFSQTQGFTENDFRSTLSFQRGEIQQIGLDDNDLSGWDFSDLNLFEAQFFQSTLAGATFSNATLQNATFFRAVLDLSLIHI